MRVGIYSLQGPLFEGEARSFNVKAIDGEITLLDNHHPLISLLTSSTSVLITDEGTRKEFPIVSGFLEINDRNELKILVEWYMEYVVSHTSDPSHYNASATIVWCFDVRFSDLLSSLIREQNLSKADIIMVAGGAKELADNESKERKEYLLDQLKKSNALHHSPRVILMAHTECGAYGGSTDYEFYKKELIQALHKVRIFFAKENISIKVDAYFADFSGLAQVEE